MKGIHNTNEKFILIICCIYSSNERYTQQSIYKYMGKINSRNKGNSYERQLAKEFTELTGVKVYTNRFINKLADHQKVDLNIEYKKQKLNIQAKNTKNNINYNQIIKDMDSFNPDELNIIYSKVTYKGEYVIMSKQTFNKIFFDK